MRPKYTEDKATIVVGIHPLLELLKAGKRPVYRVYTTNPPPQAFEAIKKKLPKHVEIIPVTREQIATRAGTTEHQNVMALVGLLPIRKKPFEPKQHPFVLLLDSLQDPRNVGAIIRSAACVGVTGIIIPQKQSAPLNAVVCKASAGLIEQVDIYQPASSALALQELKKAGYQIYLATLNGQDACAVNYQAPCCLVIGNEGTGIAQALLNQGTAITIPQRTPDISYNASVAAGILLFLMTHRIQNV